MNEDFVDPWGLDKEGRLHVRLGRQLWTELQSTLPECSLVIDNLEEYVMEAEKVMFNNKSRLGADWFEAYVSSSVVKNISRIDLSCDRTQHTLATHTVPYRLLSVVNALLIFITPAAYIR